MVSYLTVKAVLGKYTTRILLDSRVITPAGKDTRANPVFEARSLHHWLSRLARASGMVEPRVYQPGNGARRKKNAEIVLDIERALAHCCYTALRATRC
ncbi:MAG: hypothetical protein C5B58_01925 [Acidobacteria bacterium]|nr:MAG: hypothetical protein C5B58_01925 [Acidobacteriota bacterium]